MFSGYCINPVYILVYIRLQYKFYLYKVLYVELLQIENDGPQRRRSAVQTLGPMWKVGSCLLMVSSL